MEFMLIKNTFLCKYRFQCKISEITLLDIKKLSFIINFSNWIPNMGLDDWIFQIL